jgi:2-polyprenyl-3-methyl-5-hydroxy-6-metoxy-1,4-benzoquinol methylase
VPEILKLYKCNDSEYYFYYPFNISGTSHFYQKLQNFDWYYLTDKWEYNYALRYISAYSQLLEIGAGSGHFLLKAHKEKKVHIVGLELNDHAIKQAEENNVKIIKDNLESFSLNNPNCFDIVASFQVLEHITNVKNFFESSLKLLKKNGLLIVSVPNNDSFIKYDYQNVLNMPPHHMGIWTKTSLLKIFH